MRLLCWLLQIIIPAPFDPTKSNFYKQAMHEMEDTKKEHK